MSHPLPPKKEVALALLERSSVHVHLDPRGTGVLVPPWFKKQPQLVLQVGLNMPVPIPDLRLDDEGMSCTLSFNRAPFHCSVPWTAVFAMVGDDGRGMVWPDDGPPEIARQSQLAHQQQPSAPPNAVPQPQADPARKTSKRSVVEEVRAERAPAKEPRKRAKKPRPGDADRPTLQAVPNEPAPAPTPIRSGSGQKGSSRPAASPNRPKRELPPYLRIVK
jgi:stringent starvation protein B